MAHCFLLKRTFTTKMLGLFIAAMLAGVVGMAQTINYTGDKVSVEKLLGVIKQQTGYSVMFNPDLLSKANPVTIEAHAMPLKEFLDKILAGNTLSYTIENKTIFIKKGVDHSKMDHSKMDHSGMAMMRIFKVRGKVVDENGKPLSGVSVSLDNSSFGIATDVKGNFELEDVKKISTITFNHLGYLKSTVSIAACCTDGSTLPAGVNASVANDNVTMTINVAMTADVKSLDDISVVNNGFQVVTRERSTAAAAKVTNAELNTQLNTNLSSALEGKAAGLSMYRGQPLLRGVGTFSQEVGTQPLLVIDGLPTGGDLNSINIYDVESVTLLKDAAATSIYGAVAANGVLVITTKRANKGSTQVSINADYFISTKPDMDKMHYATTGQMLDYETDVYNFKRKAYSGTTSEFFNSFGYIDNAGKLNNSISYYSPLYDLYRKQNDGKVTSAQVDSTLSQWRNNDFINEYTQKVWRNEVKRRYNLAVSSATDKNNSYFSINYEGNQLRTIYNKNDNVNLYLKNTFTPVKWLSATVGINGYYTDAVETNTSYNDYMIQPRYAAMEDASGKKVYADYIKTSDALNSNIAAYLATSSNFKNTRFNLLDEIGKGLTKTKALRLRAFTDINVKLPAGFSYNMKLQYETNKTEETTYDEADSYVMRMLYNRYTYYNSTALTWNHAIPDGARLTRLNPTSRNYTFRNQLNYFKQFNTAGKNSDITALVGTEIRESASNTGNTSVLYGFNPVTLASTTVDWNTISVTGINTFLYGTSRASYIPANYDQTIHRFFSMYGNAGYTFDGKYNLTGSVRVDQADLFGTDPKYRYRPMWSAGGGWNVTQEEFMRRIHWVDYLKVRVTYGIAGSVDRSSSPFIVGAAKSDKLYTGLQYTDISDLPNPKLRWEKTTTTNLGLDYTLFHNKLTGSIDYYVKRGSDLFATVALDPTVGASSMRINNGIISNKGIEVKIGSDWLKKKDLVLTSTFIIAFNKSNVVTTGAITTSAYDRIGSPTVYYEANTPYNSVYAYKFANITNGYPTFYDEKGTNNVTFATDGTPTVKQISSVSAISRVGTFIPVFNGSFQQGVFYKGFQLNALFAFYGGHKLRKDVVSLDGYDQTDRAIANRWSESNPDGLRLQIDYPTTASTSAAGNLSQYYRYSDVNIASASFVRLRNISLSYTLPVQVCRQLHMKGVKFTAQANNLWLWSAVGNDIDPETYSLSSGTRSVPTSKTFLFGASLTL
ncbi:TonB-linked outer membrane protein, SusC/RagA family [Filimonas lacunae]|uniref:TonB-linked outer membrane protein, SusC/RagA family n=1 Tax=Filimonas lacunae TaxID=477680 RepID=A0A173MBZ0_9BACT|nr:SusC/RagA family TonB-linked outer membrane protein [Filimonas lacunae]BAV05104.1 outer membrane protein, nutrient binding [Filimonas lacunae]SIT34227.1 TonB-linked outer membrane protein, SusC/RagA family [Filimonas lacunae]